MKHQFHRPLAIVAFVLAFITALLFVLKVDRVQSTLLPRIIPTYLTPLPDRGVHINDFKEISLNTGGLGNRTRYFQADIDSNELVVAASASDLNNSLVQINLESGKTETLTVPVTRRLFIDLRVSGNFIAWRDTAPAKTPLGFDDRLIVFDRRQKKEVVVRKGHILRHDLRDDMLVWEEARGSQWGIYARDLRDGHDFTVVEGSYFRIFPRVCSREWVIFLQYRFDQPPEPHGGEVELHARHLSTNDDITIGMMPYAEVANLGDWHACDSHFVTWIPARQTWPAQGHLFDLERHVDRMLNLPTPVYGLSVKDGVVLSSAGYDIERDTLFDYFPRPDLPIEQRVGGWLVASRNMVAWLTDGSNGAVQRLFVATISRRAV